MCVLYNIQAHISFFLFFIFPRLYDIFHTASSVYDPKESYLTLVFEYVNQDLSQFIERYPPPGVPEDLIKVGIRDIFCHFSVKLHKKNE